MKTHKTKVKYKELMKPSNRNQEGNLNKELFSPLLMKKKMINEIKNNKINKNWREILNLGLKEKEMLN